MRAIHLLIAAACDAGHPATPAPERVIALDACVDEVGHYAHHTILRTRDGRGLLVSASGWLDQIRAERPAPDRIEPRRAGYVAATVERGSGLVAMTDEHDRPLGRYTFPLSSCVTGFDDVRWWDVDAVIVAMDLRLDPACAKPVTDPCAVVMLPVPKDLPVRD